MGDFMSRVNTQDIALNESAAHCNIVVKTGL